MGVYCQITEAENVLNEIPYFLTNLSTSSRVYFMLHSAKPRTICNVHPPVYWGQVYVVLHNGHLTGRYPGTVPHRALSRDTTM